jgi:hypothetical protein
VTKALERRDKRYILAYGFTWFNPRLLVHTCTRVKYRGVGVECGGRCSLLYGRKEAEKGEGPGTRYNFQRHNPCDCLQLRLTP